MRNGSPESLKNIVLEAGFKPDVETTPEGLLQVKVSVQNPEDVLGDLVKAIVGKGYDIVTLRISEPTLEDVFIYFSQTGG